MKHAPPVQITPPVLIEDQVRLQGGDHPTGANSNELMANLALEKAEEVLNHERVISLSPAETVLLVSMLDNPPKPNKVLSAAFARYKQKVENAELNTGA